MKDSGDVLRRRNFLLSQTTFEDITLKREGGTAATFVATSLLHHLYLTGELRVPIQLGKAVTNLYYPSISEIFHTVGKLDIDLDNPDILLPLLPLFFRDLPSHLVERYTDLFLLALSAVHEELGQVYEAVWYTTVILAESCIGWTLFKTLRYRVQSIKHEVQIYFLTRCASYVDQEEQMRPMLSIASALGGKNVYIEYERKQVHASLLLLEQLGLGGAIAHQKTWQELQAEVERATRGELDEHDKWLREAIEQTLTAQRKLRQTLKKFTSHLGKQKIDLSKIPDVEAWQITENSGER